ncbi:hypothetical protein HKCCSP123_12680 [Rhodobacterales bacterium HKCCSP123]|nr:hypothetical protein [Rhodobacterales bacterium HKCCSP123]
MRAIIFLGGLAMVAGFFLTWLEAPFAGPEVSPLMLLREGMIPLGADTSWQGWVFLGGFAAGGLAAVAAVLGRGSGLLALLAGASPIVVLGDAVIRAEDLRRDLGLPFPVDFGDLARSWELLQDFIRLGFWAYSGGAVLLLVAGMSVVFGPRR